MEKFQKNKITHSNLNIGKKRNFIINCDNILLAIPFTIEEILIGLKM